MAEVAVRELAPSEWMVLYGLVRYPHLSDVELAVELHINLPVLSAIKGRLKGEGYFTTIRVPDFPRIGSELMTLWYGRFAPGTSIAQRRVATGDLVGQMDELVHTETDGDFFYAILVGENYTSVRKQIDKLDGAYRRAGFFAEEETTRIQLPYEITIVVDYYDHSHLLAYEFGAGEAGEAQDTIENIKSLMTQELEERVSLTEDERRALHSLVKYPESSDEDVAQDAGMSVEDFTMTKNHLAMDGLFQTRVIPDLEKLGYDVLSFTHSRFKPEVTIEQRLGPMSPLWEFPRMFTVLTQREDVMMAAHRSLRDAREISRRLGEIYRLGFFRGTPATLLFSIADLQSDKYHDYAPITRKLLGL